MKVGHEFRSEFGWIEIGGNRFENDVIVHVDKTVSKRRKKRSKKFKEEYGHTPLSEAELDFLSREKPEVVFVGTGHYGSLPITPGAKEILDHYRITIKETPAVLEIMAHEKRPYVAILHVTC